MTTYVCLLRGVNVGGHGRVAMSELRALCASLGLTDVRTYVQSGNVVFRAAAPDGAGRLSEAVAVAFQERFGFKAANLVLDAEEWRRIARANPFAGPDGGDGQGLHVTFLLGPPPSRTEAEVRSAAGPVGNDEFSLGDGVVYVRCPDGYGRTRLSNTFFERILEVPATTRNWRTVLSLLELADPPDA